MATFHNEILLEDSYSLFGTLIVTMVMLRVLVANGHELRHRRRRSLAKSLAMYAITTKSINIYFGCFLRAYTKAG